ncbi:GNAT family N-acetyltransferase [Streptomyces sp. NPDC021093]|uniref:GNAT family N-acetyltransferase n=1 Tax=Streptomyces sp. NPDC021093 TaxID=3365112 RepID=UPI0037AC9F27
MSQAILSAERVQLVPLSDKGRFAGSWILRPPGPGDRELVEGQLGFKVHRRCWRRGLGSEGSRVLLRHGFEDLGLTGLRTAEYAIAQEHWHGARRM